MDIKILDKMYEFNFGLAFIRGLDKKHEIENKKANIKMGAGIELTVPGLLNGGINELAEVLLTANETTKKGTDKISKADLEQYLETDCEDIEKLFDDVVEALKESNATKVKITRLLKNLEAAQKAQNTQD